MKKLLILLVVMVVAPLTASAQLQIHTHKEKISDFLQKVTKVVLTGNDSLDVAIRVAMKSYWTISAYEFCDQEEFEASKENDNYYFLAVGDSGDGLRCWYLVKGGSRKPLEDMLNVATVPICPADGYTGREESLLPALACLLQNMVGKAIGSNYNGSGLTISSLKKAVDIPLYICADEFSPLIGDKQISIIVDKSINMVTAEEADELFMNGEWAAVCFVVGPRKPVKGNLFYVYVVDAATFELYYFKKHKVTANSGCGLLEEDIKAFAKGRK